MNLSVSLQLTDKRKSVWACALCFGAALMWLSAASPHAMGRQEAAPDQAAPSADQDADPTSAAETRRKGYLVQVALPITSAVQEQVENTIRRIVEQNGPVAEATQRPVIVLEFDTSNGQTGRGSRLGSCLDLSRFLISNEVSNVELVAYIPAPKGFVVAGQPGEVAAQSELTGHAVLVALACNHLAMHRDASIGQAGIDEATVDEGLRNTYKQIAAKRLTLPIEVAVSMVDPSQSLYRVDIGDGKTVFVDRAELARLEAEGKVIQSETISEPGTLPLYSSQQLAKYQLVRHRVDARRDLAERFRLTPDALEGDPTLGAEWKAVRVNLAGYVDERHVSWVINALDRLDPRVNLIIVELDCDGGSPTQCVRMAQRLADYDSAKYRTVAYIPRQARAASALIGLACDHIVMGADATLGGRPSKEPAKPEPVLKEPVQELAQRVERDWSLMLALAEPTNPISLWSRTSTGQLRIMSSEQFQELSPDQQVEWRQLRELAAADGLAGREAESMFVARYLVDDFAQLKSLYQLPGEPYALAPTITDQWVHALTRFLTSPWVTAWLLFGAMFFLMTEMSTPGVGLPGFLGTLCLLLFFWSQAFNGNVHWLEVLLFVGGLAFVGLEIFLLPGTGIFGLGGVGMIFVAIILATQTFVIPRTAEEFAQMPISLSMVFAAIAGVLVALVLFRKYLAHMPVFKRLMLHSPSSDDSLRDIEQREALVDWNHLLGQRGRTVTPLVPAGKAKFGQEVVDVVSDGELIEPEAAVRVTHVSGNRVVVTLDLDA